MDQVPALPDDVLDVGRRLIGAPVFLVGCARSGTSIFGEALAAHPRIAYLFEVSSIWNSLVPEREDHRLSASDLTAGLAEPIYAALADARKDLAGDVLLEKNPKHVLRIPFLRALFPDAKVLHIIRDGRDVTTSLMFRNRGTNWGHLEVPGWRDLLEEYPEAHHIRCAHQWRIAIETARGDAEELPDGSYLEVRYEELVRSPLETLEPVFDFLGLDVAPEVRAFAEKIQDETRGSYHAKKQVRHFVDNHKKRIGRYEENLSAEQIAEVEAACGGLLAVLGYR